MNKTDVAASIEAIRSEWGKRLLILGHHYQHPSVLRHADVVGDSLDLSRRAAARKDAECVVFCGVHFMAESADILRGPNQTVYMPDTTAGCPMASMAKPAEIQHAWKVLQEHDDDWLPVVYVNSTAAVKALCGQLGGSACTSSNAGGVVRWVFSQNKRPLFLPDEHLGANTAHDLGISDEQVALYDPRAAGGGGIRGDMPTARMVVWRGYCHVHTAFTVGQIQQVRLRWPEARIIVHPETPKEVVRLADAHGSTSEIIKYLDSLPAGATVFVGTETHLVERMAEAHRGRLTVKALSHSMCPNMARTTEAKLLALLQGWPDRNRVQVVESLREDALKSLERMLLI